MSDRSLERVAAKYGTLWLVIGPPRLGAQTKLLEVTKSEARVRVSFPAGDGSAVSGVSVGHGEVIVTANPDSAHTSLVLRLEGNRLRNLQPGFAAIGEISSSGRLAYVVIRYRSKTDPIGYFAVVVRPTATSKRQSVVYHASDVNDMYWQTGTLLGVLDEIKGGSIIHWVQTDPDLRAPPPTKTHLDGAGDVAGRGDLVSLISSRGSFVFDLKTGRRVFLPRPWNALCWPNQHTLIVSESGHLGVVDTSHFPDITVKASGAATASSQDVFSGACG